MILLSNILTKKTVGRYERSRLIKACDFIKKQTPTQVFSCEYCEIFKSTYFDGHLQTAASVFQKAKLSAFE